MKAPASFRPFLVRTALIAALAGITTALPADDKPAVPANYPLKTCVVSGESLTDSGMGDPVVHVHKEEGKADRTVVFCCKMCVPKFKKEPAKYLAKIDTAARGEEPAAGQGKEHGAHDQHGEHH